MEQFEEPQLLWVDAERHPLGLRVRVWGEETFENTAAYWRAIARHLRLTRARNLILLDELEGEGLSSSQWRELMANLEGLGLEEVRIAHVSARCRSRGECERHARDAGYDARIFHSEQDAERWLLAG